MHVTFMKVVPPHRLTSPTFKQDIIGDDNRRSSVDLQQAFDMLEEIQLLVTVVAQKSGRTTSKVCHVPRRLCR